MFLKAPIRAKGVMMNDLISALQIIQKYTNYDDVYCERGILKIDLAPINVTTKDIEELKELGFEYTDDCFYSIRFSF